MWLARVGSAMRLWAAMNLGAARAMASAQKNRAPVPGMPGL
jgi:hypothetical protein